ncbi:MAG: flap endonuclease-1 [Candidatus Micrarchaeota archaeon]|nr:flap endonuclease-1 [Candidatus Micrarchaeota archaeon]
MAVDLGKLVAEVKENIALDELAGKTIAIDAYNTIYQFLSIIRGPDGTPLMDSKGRVTSHLSGLLYRTTNLIEFGISPVFVFDGIPPVQKQRTIEARMNRRKEALEEWNRAKAEGQLAEARTYAMASTKITKDVVQSAKELLGFMGIPCIQANSEAEAQAAHMVKSGLVYATASQDYDSFLFGSDIVLRNLTITGKRRLPRSSVMIEVKPERVMLDKLLSSMGIGIRQLIWMGMLIGTDFNSGVEKVGPKTALKIVKEHKTLDGITAYLKERYGYEWETDPKEIESIFAKPDVSDISREKFDELIKGAKPDKEKVISFMCDEHGFSNERVDKAANKLLELKGRKGQKGISSWF